MNINLWKQNVLKMIKFIFTIIALAFSTSNTVAQTTVSQMSVDQYGYNLMNNVDIPENISHVKDVNNSLQKFVGSWQATHNGLALNVFISMVTDTEPPYAEFDILELDFKITNGAGTVVIDTRIAPWQDETGKGFFLQPSGNYQLSYGGLSTMCRPNYGWSIFKTTLNANPSQLSIDDDLAVILYSKGGLYVEDECPNGQEFSKFPVTDDYIIFTRI